MSKKLLFVALLAVATVFSVSAQKFKKETFNLLKGQSKIYLVFDFTGVTIDGDSEESYIQKHMAGAASPEDAEEWGKKWEGSYRARFMSTFAKKCNSELGKLIVSETFQNATYAVIVKINDIDPGWFAGGFSTPSKLQATFTIVETSNMETVLDEIFLRKTYNPYSAYQPDEFLRIDMGFEELGQELGKKLKAAFK